MKLINVFWTEKSVADNAERGRKNSSKNLRLKHDIIESANIECIKVLQLNKHGESYLTLSWFLKWNKKTLFLNKNLEAKKAEFAAVGNLLTGTSTLQVEKLFLKEKPNKFDE